MTRRRRLSQFPLSSRQTPVVCRGDAAQQRTRLEGGHLSLRQPSKDRSIPQTLV